MDTHLRHVVEQIHASSMQAVLYVTGGAASALTWTLTVPGASNTVLEALVPYSRSSFSSALSTTISTELSSLASLPAARALAAAAYRRAVNLAKPGTPVVGIAATCVLATTPPHRSSQRAFIATHSADRVIEYHLDFSKTDTSRERQDTLASRLFLQALHDAVNPSNPPSSPSQNPVSLSYESPLTLVRDHLLSGDILHPLTVNEFPDPIRAVLSGDAQYVERLNGTWNRDANRSNLIFPGSFNPLHDGHLQLMEAALSENASAVPAFEISVANPDKASVDEETILERVRQIPEKYGVIISRAPLFSQKASMYGGVQFVVGIDTAIRILSPRYYEEGGLVNVLVEFKTNRCSFVVGGRLEQKKEGDKSDRFLTMDDAEVPSGFGDIFKQIDANRFRVDVSSSEIRARQETGTPQHKEKQ